MKNITNYSLLLILLCQFNLNGYSQKFTGTDKKQLLAKEDSMKTLADSMINANLAGKRFRSDSQFVRVLVRALKTPNSFYFTFDSLQTVSRLYAPDSSFRIFTWQLKKDEYMYYQKGAIQLKTTDGSLKLYPLFDASMFTGKPNDSVRNRTNWIGAIYYKIIQKKYNGKNYYTLLGFDNFKVNSNRKWLEVLHFNEQNGEPIFGGDFFSFKNDTSKVKPSIKRFNIEYKKEAQTTFNYSNDMDMIVYDHLISETDQPERKESYIPDGDFEGFKWENGQWVHVDKVFNFKPPVVSDPMIGNAPIGQPIFDSKGNRAEEKLMEQSIKNIEKNKKQEAKKPVQPATPIKKKNNSPK
jgi:hypothetical protein